MNPTNYIETYEFKHPNWILKDILKSNLWFLIGVSTYIVVRSYLENNTIRSLTVDDTLLKVMVVVILIWNIPSIVLFTTYRLKNQIKSIVIDRTSSHIRLSLKNGDKVKIDQKDVIYSVFNMDIYYKNWIDGARRFSSFYSNFGYWDLNTTKGRYFIPSSLGNFLLLTPVFDTQYRFRYFPIPKKNHKSKPIEFQPFVQKDRYHILKDKYSEKSLKELQSIINNKNDYQKLARDVAEALIQEKYDSK